MDLPAVADDGSGNDSPPCFIETERRADSLHLCRREYSRLVLFLLHSGPPVYDKRNEIVHNNNIIYDRLRN